jgi:hypothetical protein
MTSRVRRHWQRWGGWTMRDILTVACRERQYV